MMTKQITLDFPHSVSSAYYHMFTSKSRYLVYKGSRGSGKSMAVSFKVVHDMIKYPWLNWLVVRQYGNTLKDSTYSNIKQTIELLGMSELFKFKVSPLEITYIPNGTKIYFKGMDDPLKLTSITPDVGKIARVWWEEAYEFRSYDDFDKVDKSIRGFLPEGGFYQHVVTFNPWNEGHWLKRTFFDEDTKLDNTEAYTTTYKDNPFLDDEFVNMMVAMIKQNPNRARVVVFGDWGISEGLVYDNVEVGKRDVKHMLSDGGQVFRGLDFGYSNDPTAFIEGVVNPAKREIYLYRELYKQHMNTDDILMWLLNNRLQHAEIRADYANGADRLIADLSARGITGVKKAIKYDILYGIAYIQNYKIVIHPDLKNTIMEATSYIYEKDRIGNWRDKPRDENNHLMDALRYGLEPLMINKRKYNDKLQAYKEIGLGR